MITKRDYLQAIENLNLAMTQLEPDGNNCAVCGDNDHQAWECHFNPLVVQEEIKEFTHTWRCFHCNEVFHDFDKAEEHFGTKETERPVCTL